MSAEVGQAPISETTPAIETLRPAEVYAALQSRPQGLTDDEVAVRRARFGHNRLEEEPGGAVVLRRLASQYTHLMAVLLWVGGALAFTAGLPQIGIAVWFVNLLNGAFSFWQEHRAERAVEALRRLLPSQSTVLRNGREVTVLAEELVPGDVLILREGDRISADARLVEEHEVRVDQSTLTGESRPARRTAAALATPEPSVAERVNGVYAGTSVVTGRGKAVVVATGMRTEFGGVAGLTQRMGADQSPLQRELATLTRVVGVIAVGLGLLFFVLAQLLTEMPLGRGLIFALGMIVAFVPEGLLPTVTLALALGTQRMARRQALVKRLSAVEALGSTTVICTDKTGTLTANEMTVRSAWLLGEQVGFEGVGYAPSGRIVDRAGRPVDASPGVVALLTSAALANDARLRPPDAGEQRWRAVGEPTEAALLVAATKAGIDLVALASSHPRRNEFAFDSDRKRMSTVNGRGEEVTLHVKGAPLELLDRCSHVWTPDGRVPLTDEHRAEVRAAVDAYSREALRVLGVAQRGVEPGERLTDAGIAERALVFLGLVAMLDPPRPEVADAIRTCRRAGIRILMMTGDYGLTAVSIARRIGLAEPDRGLRVVNGPDLDALDDDGLAELLREPVVLARTTPAHKLRIVTALQALGEVVAVTGDGVNDAPALKKADIGVAMGATGTDVAREAADMILLDDDFASIVAAVEEGRAVYANIRKFTGYIFTSNTPEAVPFILFGLSGGRIPIALDVMHILAVDLGTDLAPALALGAERPESGIMERPPRARDEHLITGALLRRSYLWLGPAQAAAVMLAFFATYWLAGFEGVLDLPDEGRIYASATGAALAAVVATQIGNLLAHRTERLSLRSVGLLTNRFVWWGVASELALILLILYFPPLQGIVGTAPLDGALWPMLIALSPLLLLMDEGRKALVRRRRRP